MFTRGALKQRNTCFGNGTAVEKTCQRIGRRQKTGALLGLLALLHFYLKVAVTSPAKENKRDVKQQGRHHDLLDASAKPGQAPDHGGHSRTAGPDKHNDCGNDDAACDHISTSGLHVQIGRAHAELQSLMRTSYAVFCLKQKTPTPTNI